ncbi:FUSC family protein [Arthrobacter sp. CAU 1506]|uniref:FUSC family protein n=1 Tax=Arthrobacter sp. CAU 1506 TaxID=2560052 RepID=UPI0010AC2369|nr:FUSC family protein [Arthrobacter sp. CAU 1506]TJY70123.1 FUSC family protein [Arthrobacter sp. CAU 1506]
MSAGTRLTEARSFLRRRARAGYSRSKSSFMPALRITFCAVAAYVVAERVLGHEGPLFAATSSIIALGFVKGPRVRKVLEVAIGCTLGITVGDLLLHFLGPGIWQAALVLLVSILLARFLDSGSIFTTQMALQSVLVVLLPAPAGGPFTRSLDAVIGGAFALVVTMLIPGDPRSEPRSHLQKLLDELSGVLRDCSDALAKSDPTMAWHALIRARASQSLIDDVRGSFSSAREVARISLAYRRHREEVGDLQDSAEMADLAMRNSRVFSRRLTSVINHAAMTDEAIEAFSEVLQETADAVEILAEGLSDRDPGARERRLSGARNDLAEIATRLHPKHLGIATMEGEGLVLVFRPLMVDLLEAAGLSHDDAAAYLPKL